MQRLILCLLGPPKYPLDKPFKGLIQHITLRLILFSPIYLIGIGHSAGTGENREICYQEY